MLRRGPAVVHQAPSFDLAPLERHGLSPQGSAGPRAGVGAALKLRDLLANGDFDAQDHPPRPRTQAHPPSPLPASTRPRSLNRQVTQLKPHPSHFGSGHESSETSMICLHADMTLKNAPSTGSLRRKADPAVTPHPTRSWPSSTASDYPAQGGPHTPAGLGLDVTVGITTTAE